MLAQLGLEYLLLLALVVSLEGVVVTVELDLAVEGMHMVFRVLTVTIKICLVSFQSVIKRVLPQGIVVLDDSWVRLRWHIAALSKRPQSHRRYFVALSLLVAAMQKRCVRASRLEIVFGLKIALQVVPHLLVQLFSVFL